jgi:hypothetical protein
LALLFTGSPLMATLQDRNGSYRILFLHHGKRHTFTLGKVPRAVAEGKAAKVDEILALVKSGYLTVPPGMDIVTFVEHEGHPSQEVASVPRGVPITLGQLRDRYLQTHRQGALEGTTLEGMEVHFRHLISTFGEKHPVREMTVADLQRHADRRVRMKGMKGKFSSATIKKELVTLRTAWNWGGIMGLVEGKFPPLKQVKLAKPDEKPPLPDPPGDRTPYQGGWAHRQAGGRVMGVPLPPEGGDQGTACPRRAERHPTLGLPARLLRGPNRGAAVRDPSVRGGRCGLRGRDGNAARKEAAP